VKRRYDQLFEQIYAFSNLVGAAKKAQKGKKDRPAVVRFHFKLESEVFQLQDELRSQTYRPGKYRSFKIHDPKERMISAAPYRDRVVHHALCNVIEPLFERSFIYDSYANRKGKGTHKAIERFQHYARRSPYVLKCDIRKFFPSIDHAVLKQAIRKKIACAKTLWLIDLIIDNSNPQEPHPVYFPGDDLFTPHLRKKGLPIGNLTSQFWANVYMDGFDHYMKEKMRLPYIRYVDDFVVFSKEKQRLHWAKVEIEEYLNYLRLITHPRKTQIHRVRDGVPFLGFRVYPFYRQVLKTKTRRYVRHLRKKIKLKDQGVLSPSQLESELNSWLGHIRFGHSQRLEQKIFQAIQEQRVALFKHPRGSWRVLEQ